MKTLAILTSLVIASLPLSATALVGEDDITAAYYTGDTAALEKLREQLDTGESSDALLAGYLDWRLASLYLGFGDEESADAALERGQAVLEGVVETTPNSAEAWALLSGTLGMRIGIRPFTRGMRYGRAADGAMDAALALEPNNPRVLLIDAIAKLNKPSMFGGSVKGAVESIDAALASIAEHGLGQFAWGEADLYVWRGIAHHRQKDTAAAAADFDRALDVVPSYGWARQLRADVRTY